VKYLYIRLSLYSTRRCMFCNDLGVKVSSSSTKSKAKRSLEDLEFDARDYADVDDMFERSFEDFELDTREFEDEFYLD